MYKLNQSSMPPRDRTHPASICGVALTMIDESDVDSEAMPHLAVRTEVPPMVTAPLSSSSSASRHEVKEVPAVKAACAEAVTVVPLPVRKLEKGSVSWTSAATVTLLLLPPA